jgi:hypothetical protein
MKRGLLRLQISNQLFGPINREVVAYRKQNPSIPRNCLVDRDALLTHCLPLFGQAEATEATCYLMTATMRFCSIISLGYLGSARLL